MNNYRDFFSKKGAISKDIRTLIPEGVSLKEFYKGVAIEKESVGDEFAAAKLAKGNLEKDANYYSKIHGDTDDEVQDAKCDGPDNECDDYDENGGLPLVGGALAVPHVGQPIRLGKIVQVGAEFGNGPADGELSGMTSVKGVAKDAGGLSVKSDGDKETITAGGKPVDSSIATKSVGGNVVPGEGQKQGGPNSKGTIAGTSQLTESRNKVRRIVKEVLKEITFDQRSGKWIRITENNFEAVVHCDKCGSQHPPLSDCSNNESINNGDEKECEVCGFPESECECMPESVDMKMGAAHKIVQPRQYKVCDDDVARTNQYEPEITEMYDEEEETVMNERYISLVNASRNLSESELTEMKTLREKLERLGLDEYVNPHNNPKCDKCGDELKKDDQTAGICFTCSELENNRRHRLHHKKGEYSKEVDEDVASNNANDETSNWGAQYSVRDGTSQVEVPGKVNRARQIQKNPIVNESENNNWRQNGGNGFSYIVNGKELARLSKSIGNKFIVTINGKNIGTVSDDEQGKTYVEKYFAKGQNSQQQQQQNNQAQPQAQLQPALAENDEVGVACPECGNAEDNDVLNHKENNLGGGSAICGKCGHTWNTTDEDGNSLTPEDMKEIGGMAVQHRSYRTANDDHQIPKARWSDEVYEGMSQVARTIKKGMKAKKTKKPSSKKK